MTEGMILSIVLMVGTLFLFGSSYVGMRQSWGKTAKLAAIWFAIITGLVLFAELFDLRLPN